MSFSSTSTSPTSHPAKKRLYFFAFSISQKRFWRMVDQQETDKRHMTSQLPVIGYNLL